MKSMMSVKAMIDLYVEYELGVNTWDMLRNMSFHGLISRDNWCKFYEITKGWSFDDTDAMNIIDFETGKVIFARDGEGRLVKVA